MFQNHSTMEINVSIKTHIIKLSEDFFQKYVLMILANYIFTTCSGLWMLKGTYDIFFLSLTSWVMINHLNI
jgi:hypothetical protein